MKLLAIDTSTGATVLGLQTGERIINRTTQAQNSHSRLILPAIDELLGEAGLDAGELDAIVFGRGPGSFTGLRIAVGVVQGLGYGLGVPVVPVSSMACLAQSARAETGQQVDRIFVALTARLEEIYFGTYQFNETGAAVEYAAEGVCDVSELNQLAAGHWGGAGNAWALRDKIEEATGIRFEAIVEHATPRAEDLLQLGADAIRMGGTIDALDASPVYLREEVASKPPVAGR